MASQLEELLQETLGDLSQLSPEKIEALVQEALKTFALLQEMGKSADPEERAEAAKMAVSLKEMIKKQTETLSTMAQESNADLSALAEAQQGVFNKDTLQGLNAAREKISAFQEGLNPAQPRHAKKHKKNVIRFSA